jgi:diacylglycerol kinase family enzyme
MHYILYNPLSCKGATIKDANKLAKRLNRKKVSSIVMDILKIEDINLFLSSLLKNDELTIIGGDGTIHRLVNKIRGINIPNNVYVCKTGTGNDFYRSLQKEAVKKMIKVNDYLYKLPTFELPEYNISEKFINGCGVGLDGLICYRVNTSDSIITKGNYFKKTLKSFREYQKIDKVEVVADGKPYNFERVWFCSVMNSRFQGGGMAIAPKAKRSENTLYLVVVKKYSKIGMLLRFLLIYLGWHTHLRGVSIIPVNQEATISSTTGVYFQVDGDTNYPVTKLIVRTQENS